LLKSTWQTSNGTLAQIKIDSSVPIVLDYDNVLGNNVALRSDALQKNATSSIMVNAYIMQQALLYELTTPKYYVMADYLTSFAARYPTSTTKYTVIDDFMRVGLGAFDFAFVQSPYVSAQYEGLHWAYNEGTAFFDLQPQYKVKKQDAYIFCLCLFLPIIWWLVVWLVSLKKTGGVSRGSSQIALLTTGMTPAAEHNLRGFSNLDSSNAFKRGQNIRVRLGLRQNQVTFGMEDESDLRPLTK
jgi:hypothetical protein